MTTLKYGSKGDEVRRLQEQLNSLGYNLSADGVFGGQTQSAVKQYQQANNLSVDGIAGNQTWGALNSTNPAAPAASPTTPTKTTQDYLAEYEGNKPAAYTPSENITNAENALKQYEGNKPGEYQSPWQDQIKDLLNNITNRDKFQYDMNADPIYNQYKDMYAKQGQQAMMDTMGNAASLTGGYGSSYASTAGNQAYQAYLQQLNNVVPDLANNAYGRYRDEGNDMYNQMGLLQGMDSTDYGKHRDSIGDYYTDLNYQYGKTRDMSQEEYNKYVNDLNAWQSDRGYYYGKSQDEQSQQNWQTQWDYQLAQDAQASKGGGGGRSSGGSGSSSGSLSDIEAEARRLYQSDPDSAYAFLSSTGVSDAQANAIIRKFNDLTKGWEVEIGAMDLAKKPTKK